MKSLIGVTVENNNIEVIGNESSVLYYNLNKQYSNIRKVVITKEALFSSYDDSSIEEVFSKLEHSNLETYSQILSQAKSDKVFESTIKADLYKNLNDLLPKISGSMADIKLKEYSFMNSVSNTKFNVSIRCESFSITRYFEEKTQLLTAIKTLVKEYLEFKGNYFRQARIKNFHIEIYEAEEITKYITLKKEGTSLILSSIFGFEKNSPIDHTCGNEFYLSEADSFNFYKNNQTSAIVREYNKLVEAKTRDIDKILTNEELVMINNNTKQINDVILEMYINRKGVLKIVNVLLSQNALYYNSKNGFIINRSSKNYTKINLVSLRDIVATSQENTNLLDNSQELVPKFLLIRNESEVKDLLLELEKVNFIQGIIFNTNFYSPILDKIGQVKDIDIIYYNKTLSKLKELKIDINTLDIEMPTQNENSGANPFSNILNQNKKGLDMELEKLKRVEAMAQRTQRPAQGQQVAQSDISNLAQGLISSPNATTSNNTSKMAMGNNNNQGKKSAISFLADTALASVASKGYTEDGEKIAPAQVAQQQQRPNPQDVPIRGSGMSQNQPRSFIKMKEPAAQPQAQAQMQSNVQQAVYGSQQQAPQQPMFTQGQQQMQQQPISAASILDMAAPKKPVVIKERYDTALAVKIMTNPGINSNVYFADANNISEISGGEVYFLTTNPEEMTESSIKYILPVTMYNENIKKCHLLINSINELFLLEDKKENMDYFVNLSHVDESIKKNYLKSVCDKFGRISVIMLKEDAPFIESIINKVDAIYVRDIESDLDLEEVKAKVLSYEKRFLMKNF